MGCSAQSCVPIGTQPIGKGGHTVEGPDRPSSEPNCCFPKAGPTVEVLEGYLVDPQKDSWKAVDGVESYVHHRHDGSESGIPGVHIRNIQGLENE